MTTIPLDPRKKCIVTVIPGEPLDLGDGTVLNRAHAECSRHGLIIAGAAGYVIEYAAGHAS